MDLSKVFDMINNQLLIAKLYAHGVTKDAREIICDYVSDRWQRSQIT